MFLEIFSDEKQSSLGCNMVHLTLGYGSTHSSLYCSLLQSYTTPNNICRKHYLQLISLSFNGAFILLDSFLDFLGI